MKLLLDTNILVALAKDPSFQLLTKIVNPDNRQLFISIISIAELKSIALQNKWGAEKWQTITVIVNESVIIL
jgi:tRNA(fMet)-specific endonuclease VapC